jgi:hypothetical protein
MVCMHLQRVTVGTLVSVVGNEKERILWCVCTHKDSLLLLL